MSPKEDLRPALRQKANGILGKLQPQEREALLVKCWMSHDARWFMAAARECGMEVTNRLNRTAAHEVGKVEAKRIARALGLLQAITLDDYLLAQEIFIGLLGPDLLDYGVGKAGDNACQVHVRRCFAYENAERAGIADHFECGIFARVTGWTDALGLAYEISPPLGRCLKAQGRECVYTITLVKKAAA
jgi:hypothetical protein